MKQITETYMTKNEASIRLQVSIRTISRMITSGRLKAIKIGNLVRIPRTSFDALSKEASL